MMHWCSCWEADIATRRAYRISQGEHLGRRSQDGPAFRRSATSFTTTSNSVIPTRAMIARLLMRIVSELEYVATLLILPSHCRCMNIPARYCTGYLGDIGVRPDLAPMDFSAWFEVFLDGRWLTFDARHNRPRIGRILIAQGRDAADVAISTSFGAAKLTRFKVITDELALQSNAPADRARSLSFA
jgi:hypothetical protein